MRISRLLAFVSLAFGAGASALVVVELSRLPPAGDWPGWPAWLPWAGLALAAVGLAATWLAERREHRRRHDTPLTFLDPGEEQRVVDAIRTIERRTSGEIRVHLAFDVGDDPVAAATRAFDELGMASTRERNGVLLVVAVHERRLAVIGDEGIDRVTGDGFWSDVVGEVEAAFGEDERLAGLLRGIELVGEALARHFPAGPDEENELPDGLSRSGR